MRELIIGLCMLLMIVVLFVALLMLGSLIGLDRYAKGETFQLEGKTYACVEQPTPD